MLGVGAPDDFDRGIGGNRVAISRLPRKAPGKDSFRLRRKVAARDEDFAASLIIA